MSGIGLYEFADKMHELMSAMTHEFVRRQENEVTKGKITITQLLIMEILMKRGESKMTDLAHFMGVSTPAMTGIVDRLVRDGYVSRLLDSNDRRIIKTALTVKGEGVVKKITEQRRQMVMKLFGQISGKEREDYLRILTRIHEIASQKKD